MSEAVIKVQNLSKRYRIGAWRGHRTFREALVDATKAPLSVLRSVLSPLHPQSSAASSRASCDDNTIWALKNVSFEVKQGEVVGIIGRNGAGKSTLLKILSEITDPTEGRIELRGRVGSLLEVGTGFHSELTGHENIYLYGAILGMDRWEVTRKFDQIVAFAELEKFVDTPVKRYSSGMYMRLAFAVAAHLEPEILLIDEVLAVGDADFQRKCLGKMDDVAKEGRTILFVSHNMAAVRNLCTRAMLVDEGIIRNQGDVHEIVSEYESCRVSSEEGVWINSEKGDEETAFLGQIEILNKDFERKSLFTNRESIFLKFTVHVTEENPALKLGFDLVRHGSIVFRSQQVDAPKPLGTLRVGVHEVFCEISARLLNVGEYYVTPLLSIHNVKYLMRENTPILRFRIILDARKSPFHILLNERNHPGAVFPLLNWYFESNTQ